MKKTEYRKWKDCYLISNAYASVIVNASAGGRVMRYEISGQNIIYENSRQDGKLLDNYLKEGFDPDGGRFDIGQEKITKDIHQGTYIGPWEAEIINEYTLKITSMPDTRLGLQLTRIFSLDPGSSKLDIDLYMQNISDTVKDHFFWSRTLVHPEGKLFMPLHPESAMPCGWGRYIWGKPDRYGCDPEDPGVEVTNNIFTLLPGKAGNEKYGNDSYAGWMAYGWEGLLFIKEYVQPENARYGELFNQTNIFYTNGIFAEMEPISPS